MSLSEYGKRWCTKPDFLYCPESIDKQAYVKPDIDAIIIVGPALVEMNHPESNLKAWSSYCAAQLINKVNSF